ncbi:MAG: hypothetical protein P8Y60_01295, partial [Calditrichota bacterium]
MEDIFSYKNIFVFFVSLIFLPLFLLFAEEQTKAETINVFNRLSEDHHWKMVGKVQELYAKDLLDLNTAVSDYMFEYNIQKSQRCGFIDSEDSTLIKFTLFLLENQVLAFGLYSTGKSPSLKYYDIGFQSFLKGSVLFTWYGNYVLQIESPDTTSKFPAVIEDFAKDCVKFLPKQKQATPILYSLPNKNRVKYSEKFYKKHWLDQEYFQNIYYADYYIQEGFSRIFIIDNLTTAAADSNFWRYFNFIKNQGFILQDSLEIETDYFVI